MGLVMGWGPGDSRRCCCPPQDLWCNSLPLCIAANKQGGFELPLVARFGLGADDWRCYSPSALNKAKSNYTGGPAFCTTPELASILAICNGSQPGPYPSPPTAAPPPPAGGCTTPFIAESSANNNATLVMNIGQDGTTYRIPVVMKIPGTHTVIMLSENRGHSGDSGQHKLALATSDDDGQSWSSVRNIYNDSTPGSGAGTTDGLNLGAAVWDARRKRFTVLFNECADQYGKAGSGCGPTGQLLQIDTDDLGVSWSAVANHTANLLSQGYVQLNPGPGTGVQLQHQKDASKNGRLIMPAWGKPHDYCCGLGCILPRDASNDRANRHEEGLRRTRRLERRGPDLRATAGDSRGAGGRDVAGGARAGPGQERAERAAVRGAAVRRDSPQRPERQPPDARPLQQHRRRYAALLPRFFCAAPELVVDWVLAVDWALATSVQARHGRRWSPRQRSACRPSAKAA